MVSVYILPIMNGSHTLKLLEKTDTYHLKNVIRNLYNCLISHDKQEHNEINQHKLIISPLL